MIKYQKTEIMLEPMEEVNNNDKDHSIIKEQFGKILMNKKDGILHITRIYMKMCKIYYTR